MKRIYMQPQMDMENVIGESILAGSVVDVPTGGQGRFDGKDDAEIEKSLDIF